MSLNDISNLFQAHVASIGELCFSCHRHADFHDSVASVSRAAWKLLRQTESKCTELMSFVLHVSELPPELVKGKEADLSVIGKARRESSRTGQRAGLDRMVIRSDC